MTISPNEFKAWLEGYMLDRASPDAQVIAKKAATILAAPIWTLPRPYPPAIAVAPAFAPYTSATSQAYN
jgi:hypothetical protein